jgi:hypothetical protein
MIGARSGGFGDYPPNITAGTCLPWQNGMGYSRDPDGYIYQNGVATGKKECQSYAQPDIRPTVNWVPPDVANTFASLKNAGQNLATDEATAQTLARRAQAVSGDSIATDLVSIWTDAQACKATAETHWELVNKYWDAVKALDDQAGQAYTNGNYAPSIAGQYAQVMDALKAQNHAPIAWDNVQAALQAVSDMLDFWIRGVFYQDLDARFQVMSDNAGAVADTFYRVQFFLSDLNADAAKVTLSQAAGDAIAGAKPSLEALADLATQVGALFSQAQDKHDAATAALDNYTDPVAVYDAFNWMKSAQPPFVGAGEQAAQYATDIHQRLDKTAKDLADYVIQHPELSGDGSGSGSGSAGTKHTGLVLGLGGVGVVALLIKKGLIFG